MKRLLSYAGVGAVATAAHYALLLGLVEVGGVPAPAASAAGAVLGAQVAWAGNRWLTFAALSAAPSARSAFGTWWRFQGTAVLGAATGAALVAVSQALGQHYLVGQVAATAAGLVLTYAVNRRWTFR